MSTPLSVGVLFGGISSEQPVSLVSGAGMLRSLDTTRFTGFPVLISLENEWIWPSTYKAGEFVDFTPEKAKAILQSPPPNWKRLRFPFFADFPRCDIFLIGLHGIGGEDGRLQGLFELMQQPFTGSGSIGSALSMDKILSKQIYQQNGIPTAPYQILLKAEYANAQYLNLAEKTLHYPIVVKDPLGGSSLGMGIAKDRVELEALVKKLSSSPRLLLEAFLAGGEATCGVLDHWQALPPTEIRPLKDGFFNFEAKYTKGRTEEITPAPFSETITLEIQRIARACHHALQLSVYSRTDFRIVGDKLFVLETNNLPGFTPMSLLPQQAACVGLSYTELLNHILHESLQRFN